MNERATGKRERRNWSRFGRWLVIVCCVISAYVTWVRLNQLAVARDLPESFAEQMPEPTGDFSQFLHSTPYHARLPCLLCHRRESSSAQPTLPGKSGHAPCTGCHAKQFAD